MWDFLNTLLEELTLHSVHPRVPAMTPITLVSIFPTCDFFRAGSSLIHLCNSRAWQCVRDGEVPVNVSGRDIFLPPLRALSALMTQILLVIADFLPQFYSEDICQWPSSSRPQPPLHPGWEVLFVLAQGSQ